MIFGVKRQSAVTAGGRVSFCGDAGGGLLAEPDVAAEAGEVLVAGLGLELGAVRPSAARCWRAEWRSWCRIQPFSCGSSAALAYLNRYSARG